jgi:cytochrome b6-f complex iron-sulfur subunit
VRRRKRRGDVLTDAVADGEALPAGRVHDPEDADALRAAIALRGAAPAADLPSEAFVAGLRHTLAEAGAPPASRRLSRRALVGAAGAVAAGAAVVATVDRTLLTADEGPSRRSAGLLDPVDGEWTPVATEADVAGGAPQRFATTEVIGFVTAVGDDLAAVSASCTHLGCILQQNDAAGRFDCPCHRTAFAHDGRVLYSQLPTAPAPLTRLQVRRRDGSVEVLLPRPT